MSSVKKVLIITYYWPPLAGSGVQRWLKFVKYLPQYGWKPYVFTPENPAFDLRDESLLTDVPPEAQIVRIPIWEPYDAFFRISKMFGKKKQAKPSQLVKKGNLSFFEKVSTWIRGNVIIPDPRRFWIGPSVKFLQQFLTENEIGIVITTGPPHSMHLIGCRLKKKMPGLKWIADFRDPWSEWGLLDSLMVGSIARKLHQRLEYKVLSSADAVTTITPFYVKHFERLGKRKVELLNNGFDEDDFKGVRVVRQNEFLIRHVGIVNEKCDPRPFMLALKDLMQSRSDFATSVRIEYIGEVNPSFREFVLADNILNAITTFTPTIPHKQLIGMYGTSALHVLILTGYKDAEGYMPGKLYEYLAVGVPIVGVGPVNGDAAELLKLSGAGEMIATENHEAIKKYISDCYEKWNAGTDARIPNKAVQYSRKVITGKLTEFMSKILGS